MMTPNELNRAVARATGESVRTIAQRGFGLDPLDLANHEPLVVDWEQIDAQRVGLFPQRSRADHPQT